MEGRSRNAAEPMVPAAETTLHVLLVEDDDEDVLLVGDLLEEHPEVRLSAVPTLAAAAGRLAAGDVRCVLLDLHLPDAVGLDAVDRLLALEPDVAVVVLTGETDDGRGAEAVAAGAQDYLVKGRIDAGTLVRAVRYAVERRSSERWRQEVAVARAREAENARLQRGLLPAPVLLDDGIRVATAYRPGQRRQLLGGDLYDVVQTDDGVLHAVVADVSGHGPDEAALGVRMRMAWRTLVLSGAPDDELAPTLELVLGHERDHDGVFLTLAGITVAADRRSAVVRLAGHPPPVLLAGGAARLVEGCASGPVLGLGIGASWPATEVALPAGWTLLLYTDGLFEGADGPGRLGLDGLVGVLDGQAAAPVGDAWLTSVITEVERRNGGPLGDDVALLALGARSPAG